MSILTIEHVDSVNIKIDCERGVAKELSDFFTFKVPGHQYMPAFRNKIWDGQIKLYNIYSQLIYAGLYDYIVQFATDRNYSINEVKNENKTSISKEHIESFINDHLKPYAAGENISTNLVRCLGMSVICLKQNLLLL